MRKIHWSWLCLVCTLSGCGPSAHELREQTVSTLNQVADTWDGGADFKTDALDAYGRPIIGTVEKRTLDRVLLLRSHGPDGLPKNSDDVSVSRSKRHGETTFAKEAENVAEPISRGIGSGLVQGIRKGLEKK